MKSLFMFAIFCAMALMSWPGSHAAINLNSSRSNIYRLVYSNDLMTQAQGDALANELGKLGPMDEAKLKAWFANNFKRQGIDGSRVKTIRVLLQQGIDCATPAGMCKGKWKGPALNSRGERSKGDCFCYEPVTTAGQTERVSKDSPIVIFLLADSAQENDAFAMAVNLNSSKSN